MNLTAGVNSQKDCRLAHFFWHGDMFGQNTGFVRQSESLFTYVLVLSDRAIHGGGSRPSFATGIVVT